MKKSLVIFLIILSLTGLVGLSMGDVAPNFSAKNQDGKVVTLSQFQGKPVILYFYPKDDTPGCTKEACSFRDQYSQIQKMGAVVLGVSRQDEKSHQAFQKKYHLPFDLLVDEKGEIAKEYGVGMVPVLGLHHRQSVLISADGKVAKTYMKVDPEKHSDEVIKDLQGLMK